MSKTSLVGGDDAGQVAAGGVQDALRLRGRAGGVEEVEHVLGVERLGRARRRRPARAPRATRRRGPPSIGHVAAACARTTTQCSIEGSSSRILVDVVLHRDRLAAPQREVGGDEHLRLAVVHAVASRPPPRSRRRRRCGWRRCARRRASRRASREPSACRSPTTSPFSTPSAFSTFAKRCGHVEQVGVGDRLCVSPSSPTQW